MTQIHDLQINNIKACHAERQKHMHSAGITTLFIFADTGGFCVMSLTACSENKTPCPK